MEFDLETTSKRYFSNISALAKKIATDIENTQEAYQDFWHSLSKREQDQVIDESIISPPAVIKYANIQLMAAKENPNIYSWFTKSQLNLFNPNLKIETLNSESLFPHKNVNQTITKEIAKDAEKSKNEKCPSSKYKDPNFEKKLFTNSNKGQMIVGHKASVLKPKTPPPPPPFSKNLIISNTETDLSVNEYDSKSNSSDIPKTGFDFLDNW